MSRKFDRKRKVIALASMVLDQEVKRPGFAYRFIKPKPKWIPRFLWVKMVKTVIQV